MNQLQFLLENEVSFKPGFKAANDLMVLVGNKVVSFTDIAEAMLELWNDGKYPTAFVGKLWEICQKSEFDSGFVIQLKIPAELQQFCQIIHHLYRNEERLYPRNKGKQGGNYLISFLWDVLQAKEVSDEILKQYRLVR